MALRSARFVILKSPCLKSPINQCPLSEIDAERIKPYTDIKLARASSNVFQFVSSVAKRSDFISSILLQETDRRETMPNNTIVRIRPKLYLKTISNFILSLIKYL